MLWLKWSLLFFKGILRRSLLWVLCMKQVGIYRNSLQMHIYLCLYSEEGRVRAVHIDSYAWLFLHWPLKSNLKLPHCTITDNISDILIPHSLKAPETLANDLGKQSWVKGHSPLKLPETHLYQNPYTPLSLQLIILWISRMYVCQVSNKQFRFALQFLKETEL